MPETPTIAAAAATTATPALLPAALLPDSLLRRFDTRLRGSIPLAERGHAGALFVFRLFVAALLVEREKAGEEDNLAGRTENCPARSVGQLDGGAFQASRRHLARERPIIDKLVEARVIAGRSARLAEVGRTDCLVGLLRVLRLARVAARLVGHVAAVIAVRDRLASGADRLLRHVDAVGPHVGDQPVLVERLGDPHRVASREAELARGLLLKRRSGERRRRVLGEGFGLDRRNGEAAGFDLCLGGIGLALAPDRKAIDLLAVKLDEARRELLAIGLKGCADLPIFLGLEDLDLALAVDDQA